MAWDWDHLARNADEEFYGPKPQRRWTRSERFIAALVVAVLAATVLLAYLTPGVKP